MKKRCPHIPDETILQTFNEMDLNKDGQIDKDEMFVYVKNLMSKHHSKKKEEVKEEEIPEW